MNQKEYRLSVRLSPNQKYQLDEICKELEMEKAPLVRWILDKFLDSYEKYKDENEN